MKKKNNNNCILFIPYLIQIFFNLRKFVIFGLCLVFKIYFTTFYFIVSLFKSFHSVIIRTILIDNVHAKLHTRNKIASLPVVGRK